jgi:hypothetical protein
MNEQREQIMSVKINLQAVRRMWNLEISGDTNDGEIDLVFDNLMSAAAFVDANEIADRTRLTFQEDVTRFNQKISITISNYTEVFEKI